MVGKRTFQRDGAKSDGQGRNYDIESGPVNRRFGGFKDAVEYVIDRRTTASLKKQLKEGVEGDNDFEKLRKSDKEARIMTPSEKSHKN